MLIKQRGGSQKGPHHKNNWVPEDKRIEVATLYAVLKNWQEVADLSKMSVSVIRKWKEEPWFQNVVSRVVKEKNDVLDQKLSDVIHSCADLIKDRLVNGDIRVNYKNGEQFTVPLDARGLAMVMGILFDKRQLIRGEATSRTENISFDRRLENLKETFERFSAATQIEGILEDNDELQQEEPQIGQGQEAASGVLDAEGGSLPPTEPLETQPEPS